MTWLQRITEFPGSASGIEEAFAKIGFAAGTLEDRALFARPSDDLKEMIYMISPQAAGLAPVLGGSWTEVDPTVDVWALCVGRHGAHAHFGFRSI